MGISSITLGNKEVEYVTRECEIITKIGRLGKNTLDYLVQHKYVLAVAIWSYVAIEVGAIAIGTLQEDYVYDVDSCRERLCGYWDNSTTLERGLLPKYLKSRCNSTDEKFQLSYSFMKCLQDLCKYTKSIGERFYACPKLPDISNKVFNFWDKVCPKKGHKFSNKLSELSYLNKCIKKICNNSTIKSTLDKNTLELCETKSAEKLYDLLEGINKSLKKLQKSTENADSWTQASVIGAVVGGLAGLIGGAAGIATAIITYQAGQVAAVALGEAIPTISLGLENIAKTTAETAVALLHQTTSQVGETISMDTLDTLNELSSHIQEHSLSYYSVDETFPHKLESANPGSINEAVNTFGQIDAQNVDALDTYIGSNIIKNILVNISTKITDKGAEIVTEISSSTILPIREIPGITKKWISYMKNTLPIWQDSFCYYEKSINLLVCRLPLPRHRSESKISFFILEIEKFFSEDLAHLCHYFGVDLWCNWNQFLDLIFSKRNISFFMDEECPWDEFALKVHQVLNDTYRVDAIGSCYNETLLIKV